MMKHGDKGATVKELQHAVLALGYALPRWGVDGDLGEETLAACSLILRMHGKYKDADANTLTDEELAYIFALRDLLAWTEAPRPPDQYYDCRGIAKREVDRGPRAWSAITRICLHQTACHMGENAPRYAGIGCHDVVTRGGKHFRMHDEDRIVWHGNGWNASSVGIEFDGLYAGRLDDPKTAFDERLWSTWDNPETKARELAMDVTDAMVATGCQVIEYICGNVARHGGKILQIVAHRQSSENRRNDPGEEIWKRIALPMMQKLGLDSGGTGFKTGSGYPIPECWDASHEKIQY